MAYSEGARARAIQRIANRPGVSVDLSASELFLVIAQVQLALRHPRNIGLTATVATRIVNELAQAFADDPVLMELVKHGFDRGSDIAWATEGEEEPLPHQS